MAGALHSRTCNLHNDRETELYATQFGENDAFEMTLNMKEHDSKHPSCNLATLSCKINDIDYGIAFH